MNELRQLSAVMIRPRQTRLKLSKSQFQHCQQLSEESAKVWNFAKNFFWRTYRKKGIWLSEGALACDAFHDAFH